MVTSVIERISTQIKNVLRETVNVTRISRINKERNDTLVEVVSTQIETNKRLGHLGSSVLPVHTILKGNYTFDDK